ncbi:MAG: sigma-70 family RNA polymerase sigma factor, partial [Gemmatimonadales bacterium]|nr:sigma-70 family RNA polymerase sigma factor [Gemmatimonadales bacterium]
MGDATTPATVTDLLLELQQGRPGALERLVPVVYDELRAIAAGYLRRDRGTATLQPTALVHELYFKLVDQRRTDWATRGHFFATAALLMRRLIIDHARAALADKRGGGKVVTLDADADIGGSDTPADLVRVDEALAELAVFDPRQAKVVEMRFFGGLTNELIAESLGISIATVKRDWAMARAWLAT